MATGAAVAGAAAFTWLGMVLAISFLEAPLKFRAPEVSVRIGRLVFRALNAVEAVLARRCQWRDHSPKEKAAGAACHVCSGSRFTDRF